MDGNYIPNGRVRGNWHYDIIFAKPQAKIIDIQMSMTTKIKRLNVH